MSVEFSGQITRSGLAALPAATLAASLSVAATWLRVTTSSALSCPESDRARGTLPWMAATVAVLAFAGTGSRGSAAGSTARAADPASASAGATSRRRSQAEPANPV